MIKQSQTIYFISNAIFPLKDMGGGSVVIYRHLKRLQEEGFRVVFVNCNPNRKTSTEFDQINIPKKIWHPPLRRYLPWLTNIRFSLNYTFLKKQVSFQKNDRLIAILEDPASLQAYIISKKTQIPYYLFFHDDNVFNEYAKTGVLHPSHLRRIVKYCSHFFVVSKSMVNLIYSKGNKNVTLLYPIPAGNNLRKDIDKVNFDRLAINYSGMILSFQEQLFKTAFKSAQQNHASLTLISNLDEVSKKRFLDCEQLQILDSFPKLEDLFKYLIEYIDILLVVYSFDLSLEVRSTYSFPSKLTEFCHLGIPIIIIGPAESAVGKWAIENNWISFLSTDNQKEIELLIQKFKNPAFWKVCQKQCLMHANFAFNPEKFINGLNKIYSDHLSNNGKFAKTVFQISLIKIFEESCHLQ